MERTSAQPKRRPLEDEPTTQPMRPAARGQIARNPSTDQKKVRREMSRRTATQFDTQAWRLNPGDQIRLSNGMTQRVTRVRPHENGAGSHVYVDTDGGTALVRRTDNFTLVPANTTQQTTPGYGIPGGNFNALPWDNRGGAAQSAGQSSSTPSGCPRCKGHMMRRGDHFQCSQCGYVQNQASANDHSFSPQTQILTTFSTVNQPLRSAVSSRARFVLDTQGEHQ